MVKKYGSMSFLIMMCFVYLSPVNVFSLEVFTENAPYANYLDENQNITGHNTDIVNEIISRLKKDFVIEMAPWARGYLLLQSKPDVALYSTARTKERENLFKWVGPLSVAQFILYKKKNSDIQINSLEDAKKVKIIGCYKDDIREKILIDMGFKNLNRLHGNDADNRNLKMLLAGRIDLWITSPTVLYKLTKKNNINPYLFDAAYVLDKAYLYIAFSKQTNDEIIHEWQKTLEDMKKDGTYEKIFLKYPMINNFMTFEPPKPAGE